MKIYLNDGLQKPLFIKPLRGRRPSFAETLCSKPFVQNPLFKTLCFQQRIVSLLFTKKRERKKRTNIKWKLENIFEWWVAKTFVHWAPSGRLIRNHCWGGTKGPVNSLAVLSKNGFSLVQQKRERKKRTNIKWKSENLLVHRLQKPLIDWAPS